MATEVLNEIPQQGNESIQSGPHWQQVALELCGCLCLCVCVFTAFFSLNLPLNRINAPQILSNLLVTPFHLSSLSHIFIHTVYTVATTCLALPDISSLQRYYDSHKGALPICWVYYNAEQAPTADTSLPL